MALSIDAELFRKEFRLELPCCHLARAAQQHHHAIFNSDEALLCKALDCLLHASQPVDGPGYGLGIGELLVHVQPGTESEGPVLGCGESCNERIRSLHADVADAEAPLCFGGLLACRLVLTTQDVLELWESLLSNPHPHDGKTAGLHDCAHNLQLRAFATLALGGIGGEAPSTEDIARQNVLKFKPALGRGFIQSLPTLLNLNQRSVILHALVPVIRKVIC
mmetsp:Transcript_92677/g.271310  ORF Transcript_92677/g.271310 Transcript_92677/m.271310 type:complete len:221 (+) Transcript_92677:1024-1686(+)